MTGAGQDSTILFTQNLTGLRGLSFCKTFAKTDAPPSWQCGCASRGFRPHPSQSSASFTSLSWSRTLQHSLSLPEEARLPPPRDSLLGWARLFRCLAPLASLLSSAWIASPPAQPSSSVSPTEGEFQEPAGAWSTKNQRRLRS